jgi:hypothetical protein
MGGKNVGTPILLKFPIARDYKKPAESAFVCIVGYFL